MIRNPVVYEGNPDFHQDDDEAVQVPTETAERRLTKNPKVSGVLCFRRDDDEAVQVPTETAERRLTKNPKVSGVLCFRRDDIFFRLYIENFILSKIELEDLK